jgi:hypothetical protein
MVTVDADCEADDDLMVRKEEVHGYPHHERLHVQYLEMFVRASHLIVIQLLPYHTHD